MDVLVFGSVVAADVDVEDVDPIVVSAGLDAHAATVSAQMTIDTPNPQRQMRCEMYRDSCIAREGQIIGLGRA